jgi:hypothetical protein
MDLQTLVSEHDGQSALAKVLGCNKSWINRQLKKPEPGLALALRVYQKLGRKIGPIAGATEAEIETLRGFAARRARD